MLRAWQEAMAALYLIRIILIPAPHGQRAQHSSIGKLQVGHVPVQQLPLQLPDLR